MVPVFVFGTLKEGFPNFSTNKGVRLAGEFLTEKRYSLYLVGERYSPWLVFSEGDGFQIRGQVFMVDEDTLKEMDRLERVGEMDGYRRVQIPVISESDNEQMIVFVYGKPPGQLADVLIQSGPIAEYEHQHASLYRERKKSG